MRPIGVFDSGLGGLTAVRALEILLPNEDIIYFGDTARAPYGACSLGTIDEYLRQNIAFLRTFDIKLLIIACGTASAACLPRLDAEYPFPLLGVIEPSVSAAAAATKNGRVGLIATEATVSSRVYEITMRAQAPEITVTARACPLLAPLVENGRGQKGDTDVEILVREYLRPIMTDGVDTLILGCTHYPLLSDVIRDILGDGVNLVDSGEMAARAAAEWLYSDGESSQVPGMQWYFVSDKPEAFAKNAALYLGQPLGGSVQQVDIEPYM